MSKLIKLLDIIIAILIRQSFLTQEERKDLKIALWEAKMQDKENEDARPDGSTS